MLKIVNLSKKFNINTDNEINIFKTSIWKLKKINVQQLLVLTAVAKSTLLNIIGGSILADKGQIVLNGHNMKA